MAGSKLLKLARRRRGKRSSTGSPIFLDSKSDFPRVNRFLTAGQRGRRRWVRSQRSNVPRVRSFRQNAAYKRRKFLKPFAFHPNVKGK